MAIIAIILALVIAVISFIIIYINRNYDPGINVEESSEEQIKERINSIRKEKRKRTPDWKLSASGKLLRDQNEINEMELELSRRERREENKKSLEKLNRRFKNDQ